MRIVGTYVLAVAASGSLLGCGGSPPPNPPRGADPEQTADGTPAEEVPVRGALCRIESEQGAAEYQYVEGRLVRSSGAFHETTYTYEDVRLVEVRRGTPDRILFVLHVNYDDEGHPVEVTTARPWPRSDALVVEQTRRFEYEEGRLVGVTDSEGTEQAPSSELTFDYDSDGRVERTRLRWIGSDEPPTVTRYLWDERGQLSAIVTEGERLDFEHAASGERVAVRRRGERGEPLGEERLVRDDAGRLVERQVVHGRGNSVRITFEDDIGSGLECGELGPPPPGIPESAEAFSWLGISP